jgi:uncharacterized membrane protein
MALKSQKAARTQSAAGRRSLETALPWLMVIGGAVGTAAMTTLAIEIFDRLKNPAFVPVCNLNPILSCTNVADSAQSHALTVPNYFIGIGGYAATIAFGLALLGGAVLSRWLWRLILLGQIFAIALVTWLQFETIYRIGSLCLFCMIGWVCTIPLFWYTLLYNYDAGYISVPASLKGPAAFARRHHGDILLLWFLIIIALILKRFWYYWSTL